MWVVAPEHDQSGQSHAISLHHAIRVSQRGVRRFGVTGTPGDCAAMGICHLMKDAAPQLMLSGVNRGVNLGIETVFSGTVGGAMTAMMLGVPAIALSQAFTDRRNVPWDTARTLGPDDPTVAGDRLGQRRLPQCQFSACPADEVGPLTLAKQGEGLIAGMIVETRVDPRGLSYHWLNFQRSDRQQSPGTDYSAMRAGRSSSRHCVTTAPMRMRSTNSPRNCQGSKADD